MSQTGNTKKVAEAIYEEITVDKSIKEKIMRTSRSGLKGARKRLQALILYAYSPARGSWHRTSWNS